MEKIEKAVKKERVSWHYKDGKKTVFTCNPPKRLSKLGELAEKYPDGIIEIHNMRAVMR